MKYGQNNLFQKPVSRLTAARRGFSLLEVVIAAGIFSLVLVFTLSSYQSFVKFSRQTAFQRDASSALQQIYQRISSQIWQARSLTEIKPTNVKLVDQDGKTVQLAFNNHQFLLNGHSFLPPTIHLEAVAGKVFSGQISASDAAEQPYLKVSFILSVYNEHNQLVKRYSDPISFIFNLRF